MVESKKQTAGALPNKAAAPRGASEVAARPAPKPAVATKTEAPAAIKPAPMTARPVKADGQKAEAKAEALAPKAISTMITQHAAPVAATIKGSKTMNDTVIKAQETAKKFTADAGQKMQTMFGDASERAKASYEKGIKMTEEFTEFQKGNVEAIVESGKLAAKAAESLGQEAADYARKSFESSTAAFKTFAGAKSPTELLKLQSDYMKSYFEAAVAESTKVTEAWLKLAGDVAQPISNRMAVAVEKAKATAAF